MLKNIFAVSRGFFAFLWNHLKDINSIIIINQSENIQKIWFTSAVLTTHAQHYVLSRIKEESKTPNCLMMSV